MEDIPEELRNLSEMYKKGMMSNQLKDISTYELLMGLLDAVVNLQKDEYEQIHHTIRILTTAYLDTIKERKHRLDLVDGVGKYRGAEKFFSVKEWQEGYCSDCHEFTNLPIDLLVVSAHDPFDVFMWLCPKHTKKRFPQ